MEKIEPSIPITSGVIEILSKYEVPVRHDFNEKEGYIVGYRISEPGERYQLFIQIRDERDRSVRRFPSILLRRWLKPLDTHILSSYIKNQRKPDYQIVIEDRSAARQIFNEIDRLIDRQIEEIRSDAKWREAQLSLALVFLSIFGGISILYLRGVLQPEFQALVGILVSFVSLIIVMGLVQIATFDVLKANNDFR